jgi:hypothetical protein
MEPRAVSKELQAVIDETNRKIRECFILNKKVKASLRTHDPLSAQGRDDGR